MHHQVVLIAARQHIADLHRAADHNRLMRTPSNAITATTATSRHAVRASGRAAVAPVSFLHWLRRRQA